MAPRLSETRDDRPAPPGEQPGSVPAYRAETLDDHARAAKIRILASASTSAQTASPKPVATSSIERDPAEHGGQADGPAAAPPALLRDLVIITARLARHAWPEGNA